MPCVVVREAMSDVLSAGIAVVSVRAAKLAVLSAAICELVSAPACVDVNAPISVVVRAAKAVALRAPNCVALSWETCVGVRFWIEVAFNPLAWLEVRAVTSSALRSAPLNALS